jgi:hypothetical protein
VTEPAGRDRSRRGESRRVWLVGMFPPVAVRSVLTLRAQSCRRTHFALRVWQGWHLDAAKTHQPPLRKGDVVLRVDQCPVTPYNVGPKLREGPIGSMVEVFPALAQSLHLQS